MAVGLKTVVRHWNRFPREVVDDLGLETAKVRLNGALSTDGAVGVSVHCRGWTFKAPFQPKPFYDFCAAVCNQCTVQT